MCSGPLVIVNEMLLLCYNPAWVTGIVLVRLRVNVEREVTSVGILETGIGNGTVLVEPDDGSIGACTGSGEVLTVPVEVVLQRGRRVRLRLVGEAALVVGSYDDVVGERQLVFLAAPAPTL